MRVRPLTRDLRLGGEQVENLRQIALALARDATELEMAHIITREVQRVLRTDSICTFLRRPDHNFHLVAEIGCAPEFVRGWSVLPAASFPNLDTVGPEGVLWHTEGEEFRRALPDMVELIERNGRAVVGYAPLHVDGHRTGVIGFSFNTVPEYPLDRAFLSLLVNLCGLALERARLSEQEKHSHRAKSEFLANMSHEIRTPLGLVQGYTDLLLRSSLLDERQKRWAEVVHRATRQLGQLIGEVLDFSKIEAERLEICEDVIDLGELIDDLRQTSALRANQRGIELLVGAASLPAHIVSDPVRLRQVLLNLVGNAIKFTTQGTVKITAAMPGKNELCVEVCDTGIGIAPADQLRIFEPFTQAESSNARRFGGTGLGLPIARSCARALGGDLELVKSALGQGSTFRVRIQTRVPTAEEVQAAKAARRHRETTIARLNDLRLLLVDDSEDNQDLIGHLLRESGATVEIAPSGPRALELAAAQAYDVILMDIQMPEMDGHEAFLALRTQGYAGPVAALTAHALKSERERALANGFSAYLTKPVDTQQLCATVRQLAGLN